MNDAEAIAQIAEIIQSSLAVNGQLAFPFYKQFWANLHESPESAACYLAVLLSKLVGMTSGEDKHTPLPDLVLKVVADNYSILASDVQKLATDLDPTLLALRQSILLTLFFIGIHVRFAVVHPCMNLAFAKWIEFNAIQRWINAKTPFVDEIISILTSSFDNEESLSQIIEDATTIDVPMDLCHDLDDAHTLSRALLSAWLVRGSSFPLPKLIDIILDVLKSDNLPESRVLVVLHMLKKLVLHTPYMSHSTVHNALSLLKPYYLWPRPYGDYAREVMQILSSEARNPGHTLRSMILREFPNVLRDHPKIKYARPATHGRVIHMLVDTLHNDGSIMHDLLKSSPADDPAPAQLQYDLLGNILYRVLGIEGDILGVEHCSQDLISELLAEALTVMDHAATLPEKDAHTFRLQHIKAIRERIMEKAEFDCYAYPPRHPVPPPFHMSIIQLKCTNTRPRKSDDLTDSQTRLPQRKNCVQALAQIFSSYQHQNRSQTNQSGQPTQPNGNHSPPSNRRNHKSPPTPTLGVPQDSNAKSKRKSGNQHSEAPPQPPPPLRSVRIAVIGSDAALHTVVTGYVTLRREQPTLFIGLDVRFYIIPVAIAPPLTITASLPGPLNSTPAANHFASFIAKNDPWYYRHIWVGTYSLMSILPSGSTSLSISQLQDLAKSPSSLSQSPRQRTKSRILAVPDIDRLASSGSLVESMKAVQKQKFVANSFLTAKPVETEGPVGVSGMVGNGRLSSSTELSKTDTPNRKDSGTDDGAREDRNRKGSGGNKNVDTSASNSSNSNHTPTNSSNPSNTTVTTTTTTTTSNTTENASNVTSTTTTVTTNLNGIQEIVISSSSTEVLVLKRSPKTQSTPTNVSIATNSSQSTPINTPTSPSASTTSTTDTSPGSEDTDPKMARSSSWTTDSATADGTRRNGSIGNSATPSPNKSRSRSNSGNSDVNGIVVGQSRSRSSSNNSPDTQSNNTYALNKSSSANAIEKRTSDPPKSEAHTNTIPANDSATPPSTPTAIPMKAIFRRSNSLSDSMGASSQDNERGRVHFAHKGGLQHAHSVAEFNYDPNAQDPTPTSLPSNDAPSSVLQAPSPARILRQEFDTFVRDATQYLNVAVFQAECWTIVDNESLYFTVPFLIRAELGISAYTRFFAESNDLPASFTHQDITSHKLFKYVPVPLALKCTPVNLNGVARSVLVSEPKSYTSISLSNLGPLDKAQQNNANPTRPWLELSTVEAESKKKRREESHTHYVNIIDIETEGKKLVDVLLDGEYYGGVYKLRITTCTAPPINRPTTSATSTPLPPSSPSSPPLSPTPAATEEEQIVFPVMTYLPLNLP